MILLRHSCRLACHNTNNNVSLRFLPRQKQHTRTLLLCCIAVASVSRSVAFTPRPSRCFSSLSGTAMSKIDMSISSRGETASNKAHKVNDPVESLGLPTPLILGSGSFTRKLILKEMHVDYHLLVRSIDEEAAGGDRSHTDPQTLVQTLAKAKGDHLLDLMRSNKIDPSDMPLRDVDRKDCGWIVLTADQVVTHDNKILEKPKSIEQAKDFVRGYASSPPQTVGACVLTHVPSGVQVCGLDSATIHFDETVAERNDENKDLIDLLLEEDAPVLSCAGGLMVEHPLVQGHVQRIDGTQDSVMGLAKHVVLELLEEIRDKLQQENIL